MHIEDRKTVKLKVELLRMMKESYWGACIIIRRRLGIRCYQAEVLLAVIEYQLPPGSLTTQARRHCSINNTKPKHSQHITFILPTHFIIPAPRTPRATTDTIFLFSPLRPLPRLFFQPRKTCKICKKCPQSSWVHHSSHWQFTEKT